MNENRPSRERDTMTASQRKNRELFEMAGSGKSAVGMRVDPRFHASRCDLCVNWPACLPELGASHASMNYCARMSRGFAYKK